MRRVILAGAAALALGPGCSLFPNWGPMGASVGRPYRDADEVTIWAAAKDAFGIDWRTLAVDDAGYTLESEWDVQIAPMYRKGTRRRCFVWLIRGDRGSYLEVQVAREVNTDRRAPMDPASASWEADGRDVEKERRIMSAVDLRLGRIHDAAGSGARRPSPYREEESEAEKHKRLWEDGK